MDDDQFHNNFHDLHSNDPNTILPALYYFQGISTQSILPPSMISNKTDLLRRLMELIGRTDHHDIVIETSLVFGNWAIQDQLGGSWSLISNGVVEILLKLLSNDQLPADRRVKFLWSIGNIASADCRCRKYLLQNEALEICTAMYLDFGVKDDVQHLIWTISNLCHERTQCGQHWKRFETAIRILLRVLVLETKKRMNNGLIIELCRGLTNLTEPNNSDSQRLNQHLLDAGLAAILIDVISKKRTLKDADQDVLVAAVRTLGNLALIDEHIQVVLDAGALPILRDTLGHASPKVASRICWILSNIVSGTPEHRMMLCNCAGLVDILNLEIHHDTMSVRKEAAAALCNILKFGDDDFRRQMIDHGCIEAICLAFNDPRSDFETLKCILDALESVLKMDPLVDGVRENRYATLMKYHGTHDRLIALSNNVNGNTKIEVGNFQVDCIRIWLQYF